MSVSGIFPLLALELLAEGAGMARTRNGGKQQPGFLYFTSVSGRLQRHKWRGSCPWLTGRGRHDFYG
jgi:hypothetical protein